MKSSTFGCLVVKMLIQLSVYYPVITTSIENLFPQDIFRNLESLENLLMYVNNSNFILHDIVLLIAKRSQVIVDSNVPFSSNSEANAFKVMDILE